MNAIRDHRSQHPALRSGRVKNNLRHIFVDSIGYSLAIGRRIELLEKLMLDRIYGVGAGGDKLFGHVPDVVAGDANANLGFERIG